MIFCVSGLFDRLSSLFTPHSLVSPVCVFLGFVLTSGKDAGEEDEEGGLPMLSLSFILCSIRLNQVEEEPLHDNLTHLT